MSSTTNLKGGDGFMDNKEDVNVLKSHPRWDEYWKAGIEPGQLFDRQGASPALLKYIHENRLPTNGKFLVPGCGRAYDIAALASPDRSVLGIDISDTAIASAKEWIAQQNIPKSCQVDVKNMNFFDIKFDHDSEKFDFIYDYTFFCALEPELRPLWGSQMANLIKPGGELFTLIFPIMEKPDGPPFAVSFDAYKSVLDAYFENIELAMLPEELCHVDRVNKSGVGRWIRKQ